MKRIGIVLLPVLALTGCGKSKIDQAVDACKQASDERTAQQQGSVVTDEMKIAAKELPDGGVSIDGKIYYQRGSSDQRSQSFSCTVRFAEDQSATVQKFVIQPFFD